MGCHGLGGLSHLNWQLQYRAVIYFLEGILGG